MINTSAPEAIVAHWVTAFNTRNLAPFRQLCSQDVVVHAALAGNEELTGFSRLSALLQVYGMAFPDGQFTVEEVDPGDDLVASGWVARGTNTGPFLHLPATNKEVALHGTCRFRIVDGLVAELWFNFNLYSILEHLGALFPEPGQASPFSLTICENAITIWTDALRGRRMAFESVFSDDVVVHASCFQVRMTEVGRPALAQVLGLIHATLADIQFSVERRISQGMTTTYQGSISGLSHNSGEIERFTLDCMFRTQGNEVKEFWVRIWSKP